MTTMTTATLFERLGGGPAIQAVMERFFERILADPHLAPVFARVNIERHQRKTGSFVAAATGGPEPWTGRDMAAAHRHLRITDCQFDAVAGHLMDTLAEIKLAPELAAELIRIVGSLRGEIVA